MAQTSGCPSGTFSASEDVSAARSSGSSWEAITVCTLQAQT